MRLPVTNNPHAAPPSFIMGSVSWQSTGTGGMLLPKGWQCPVCARVWAPGMPSCSHCAEHAKQREEAKVVDAESEPAPLTQAERYERYFPYG